MSCLTLISNFKDCTNNLGGIKYIYIAEFGRKDDIGYGIEDLVVDELYLYSDSNNNDKFIKLKPVKGSVSYDVKYKLDSSGVQSWDHSVQFTITQRVPNTEFVLNLLDGSRRMIVAVKTNKDEYILLGWDYGLEIKKADGGSGSTKGAGPTYSFSLSGVQDKPEYSILLEVAEQVLPGED